MADVNRCSCCGGNTFLFPCSGGSNVGEYSDRIARLLGRGHNASMYCLAGIGGNVSGIVESTRSADKIVVIDGCQIDCAKKTLAEKGITNIIHFRITDFGVAKYRDEVRDERISSFAERIASEARLEKRSARNTEGCCS